MGKAVITTHVLDLDNGYPAAILQLRSRIHPVVTSQVRPMTTGELTSGLAMLIS